jgi:hypothetical protein
VPQILINDRDRFMDRPTRAINVGQTPRKRFPRQRLRFDEFCFIFSLRLESFAVTASNNLSILISAELRPLSSDKTNKSGGGGLVNQSTNQRDNRAAHSCSSTSGVPPF